MSLWQTPAVVLAFLAWLLAPPDGLADVARREALRRQLTPASTRSFTNQDVASAFAPGASADKPGVPGVPGVSAFAPGASADKPGVSAFAPGASADKPGVSAFAPGASADKPGAPACPDEPCWRGRMATARAAVERDQLLAEALQSRINALTTDASARDDPAQRNLLYQQRIRAIDELDKMKAQVVQDARAIDDLQDEARKQGVPAGWIR